MPKERRTTNRSHRDDKKRELFSNVASQQVLHHGLVVKRFGSQADVRGDDGSEFRCHLRKHMTGVAVGDNVEWQSDESGHSVIVNILPRRSQLQRPNPYEGIKTIAANIDHIIVLAAPLPALSELLLDRYLVAAENTGIKASIVINKCDLLDDDTRAALQQRLSVYSQLDYPLFWISTHTQEGMPALREHMRDGASVVIGQSGVGKSSLVNALLPQAQAPIGAMSDGSELGQHTTTAARLFMLDGGGQLIDSPGVREFGLWHLSPQEIAQGFRDIRELSERCRFRNCSHLREPGCAVLAATAAGTLSTARYDSFKAIIESSEPT